MSTSKHILSFTLIEIIATIVISGFVGSMLVLFMQESLNEGNKEIAELGDTFTQQSAMEVIYSEYAQIVNSPPPGSDPAIDDILEELFRITSGDGQSTTISTIRTQLNIPASVTISIDSYYCIATVAGTSITVTEYSSGTEPAPELVRVIVTIGNTAPVSRIFGVSG